MTIYVCQEPEQNRSHLHQKRENGDGSLCGKFLCVVFVEHLPGENAAFCLSSCVGQLGVLSV